MDIFPYEIYGDWEFHSSWEEQAHWGRGGRCQVVDGLLRNPVFECHGSYLVPEDIGYPVINWLERRRGAASPFFFRHPNVRRNWDFLIGVGDGSTLAFVTPFASFDAQFGALQLTVDEVAKTEHVHFSVGRENRIIRSTDFSNATTWAAHAGATVTRTSGRPSPIAGLSDAWRIQTSGGSSASKLLQTVSATGLASGSNFLVDSYIKLNTAVSVLLRNNQGDAYTVDAETIGNWVRASLVGAYDTANDPGVVYAGAAAGDSLDFDVWHPFMAWPDEYGDDPDDSWVYVPTGTTAITTATGKRLTVGFVPGGAPASLKEIRIGGGGTVHMETRLTRGPGPVRPMGLGLSFDVVLKGTV